MRKSTQTHTICVWEIDSVQNNNFHSVQLQLLCLLFTLLLHFIFSLSLFFALLFLYIISLPLSNTVYLIVFALLSSLAWFRCIWLPVTGNKYIRCMHIHTSWCPLRSVVKGLLLLNRKNTKAEKKGKVKKIKKQITKKQNRNVCFTGIYRDIVYKKLNKSTD